MSESFLDRINRTPVTYGTLIAYLGLAVLTDPISPTITQLVDWGAAVGILIHDGEPWRILTHAYLHGGLLHLVFNGYALLVLGPTLERVLGSLRFFILYVVAAISGCLCALVFTNPLMPLVGGSGAIFGILGAFLALNIRGGRTLLDFLENHGSRQLIGLIVINLMIGFMLEFVSNSAHIGGLIGGFVLVFCFFDLGRRAPVDRLGRAIQAGWIVLVVSLTLYAVFPVLRFDYSLKAFLRTVDPVRQQKLFDELGREPMARLLVQVDDPAYLARTVKRWKGD